MEARLGVRLLIRTTRNVAPTEAGERLIATLRPALDSIDTELAVLGGLRDKPSGTIRITVSEHAANSIVWPALERFLPDYPDINVELNLESGFSDVVSERFDAGVRLGEGLAKDMIAMRIGPDLRMAVVGSPGYFAGHPLPRTPRDLADHECINQRMTTSRGLYPWEFEKAGDELRVPVEGALIFDNTLMVVRAALAGFGLAYVMEDRVVGHVVEGSLIRVLDDWCDPFPGYHLYHPNRRQHSAAFLLLLDALRHRD